MMHYQGEIKSFHIVFNIYWLYQGILNLVYRLFINTLTNSLKILFVIQQVHNVPTESLFRLCMTDKFNRINLLL